MLTKIIAALMVFVLAGCTAAPSIQPIDPQTIHSPSKLSFVECSWFSSVSALPTDNPRTIPGWAPAMGINRPVLEAGLCGKVTLEEISFSMIQIAMSKSRGQEIPEECLLENSENVWILDWVMVDDPLLLEHLAILGLPIMVGNLSVTVDPAATPSASATFSHNNSAGKVENLAPTTDLQSYSAIREIAWSSGEEIHFVQQNIASRRSIQRENPMVGTIHETFPGSPVTETWVGNTELYRDYQALGTLRSFTSPSCETKLSQQGGGQK
jgi:hypothetical protein